MMVFKKGHEVQHTRLQPWEGTWARGCWVKASISGGIFGRSLADTDIPKLEPVVFGKEMHEQKIGGGKKNFVRENCVGVTERFGK